MSIEVKPAEIIGASIGDQVTWSHGSYPGASRYPGTLEGVIVDAKHSLLVIKDEEGVIRHVAPAKVRPAVKQYAVGDEVGAADFPHLPNGAMLLRDGYVPAFKSRDRWLAVDVSNPLGVREINMYDRPRTIVWLPRTYTDNR